ncbi:MAG TPA: tRNA 2-thiouridine(34) synthase MnmA [Steroidobacteraceae bacterium]|nr:tRNA 2-thiouridine(34) synthase MnmA [Steroidobacteraceae bacterium]
MPAPTPAPPSGTVLVGVSGGVDSAVAALLLKRAGHEVEGLFMANWDEQDAYCTQARDFQDARRVCETLGIPLHRVSFAAQYRERVFAHFLEEYAAGRTPNPDVLCNREVKFGLALDYMRRLGAAWLATGHYARIEHGPGTPRLLKARDLGKDQSYFLHAVDPRRLERVLFPVGELRKAEVRRLAHEAGLAVHDKPDSTGICFIGERPFREFLGRYLALQPGPIETADGHLVGEHRGLALYTLGQRSGLGVGGRAGRAAAPWYVAAKDERRNALIVVQEHDHPRLLSREFLIEEAHWLADPREQPGEPVRDDESNDSGEGVACMVKTRYRQTDQACRIRDLGARRWHVVLDTPARAVTPGQYAVFYREELCLGGGVIAARAPREPERLCSLSNLSVEVT